MTERSHASPLHSVEMTIQGVTDTYRDQWVSMRVREVDEYSNVVSGDLIAVSTDIPTVVDIHFREVNAFPQYKYYLFRALRRAKNLREMLSDPEHDFSNDEIYMSEKYKLE